MKKKKCKQCGTLTNNPSFCSRSCAATFNNQGVRRHGSAPQVCSLPNCENMTEKNANTCCREHAKELRYLAYIERWKQGLETGNVGVRSLTLSLYVRRYVLDSSKNKCSVCGSGPLWNGEPIPLQIDHIDGDATNSSPDNLRAICPTCHAQTENWGSRNKGNGRPFRY